MKQLSILCVLMFGCAPQLAGNADKDTAASDGGGSGDGGSDGGDADGGDADGEDPDDTGDPDPDPVFVRVFINEVMSANAGAVVDDVDGTADWFELYNPGDAEVSLAGWTATDDLDTPDLAPLSDGLVVPAGGWLVLWADGDPDAGAAHLPFKLSSAGEAIGVFAPDGTAMDRIEFGALPDNIALARTEDGGSEWALAASATPGESNVSR